MVEHTFIGLDVHARSVKAALLDGESGEVRQTSAPHRTAELVPWIRAQGRHISVAYEAGPTGFVLARALAQAKIPCLVAATSRIPKASADRVKTDRRDALKLAKLLRFGELTAVHVPSPPEEAARELVRAREDARGDLMRARHRVSKLLLRHGILYEDGKAWTLRHQRWLAAQCFSAAPLALAYEEGLGAIRAAEGRRDTLEAAIAEEAAKEPWREVVGRLSCLRGVATLTAFGLAVEVGDWSRFDGASIGAYLGLCPSEHSSGTRRRQGSITKTGNTHARRLLVEAAWQQRGPLRVSRELARRRRGQPAAVRVRAEQATERLHRRWQSFDARGKRSVVSSVAVARELAGWCWSLVTMDA